MKNSEKKEPTEIVGTKKKRFADFIFSQGPCDAVVYENEKGERCRLEKGGKASIEIAVVEKLKNTEYVFLKIEESEKNS